MVQRPIGVDAQCPGQPRPGTPTIHPQHRRCRAEVGNVKIVVKEDETHQVAGNGVAVLFAGNGIDKILTHIEPQAINHAGDVAG